MVGETGVPNEKSTLFFGKRTDNDLSGQDSNLNSEWRQDT